MQSGPKPNEKKPDPLADPVHDPEPQVHPRECIEEEGEPFDGNFA